MTVRATTDLFDHSYYKFNKLLLMVTGQWPYQSLLTKRISKTIILYCLISQIIVRIFTIYEFYGDSDMMLDTLTGLLLEIVSFTIYIAFNLTSHTTSALINRIRTDWRTWSREPEVNILHKYAGLSKWINISLAVAVYPCSIIFLLIPIGCKVFDNLLRNGTEPGKFFFTPNYYSIDEQKYYFYVITYVNLTFTVAGIVGAANIIMLITYTQHANGLFAALRHKLLCIGINDRTVETVNVCPRDDREMAQLSWFIDRHNDAIEYACLTERAFRWSLFGTTGFGTIAMNGLGIVLLTKSSDRQQTVTCVLLMLFLGLYFLIICVVSESVIEHSMSIRVAIYNSQWYKVSPRAQKLIEVMIMRCNIPCQLTAGNMLIMSVRTLWLTAKATFSFFAFVRSTQGL